MLLSPAFPGLWTLVTTEEPTRRLVSLHSQSEADCPPALGTGLDLGAQSSGPGHWLA